MRRRVQRSYATSRVYECGYTMNFIKLQINSFYGKFFKGVIEIPQWVQLTLVNLDVPSTLAAAYIEWLLMLLEVDECQVNE